MRAILYIQHTNPAIYPPLENSSRILAGGEWQVRFLGVHQKGAESMHLPDHGHIRSKLLPYTPPGIMQKFAYLKFMLAFVFQTLLWQPRWIYVSDCLACPAGLLITYLRGCRVLYHEHDAPDSCAGQSGFMRIVLACRQRLAKRADLIVIPQRERAEVFRSETGTHQEIHCVWNCPRRSATAAVPRPTRQPGDPIGIYYHGSINLNRVPLELIEGAAASGVPVLIRVVGYETIGSKGTLEKLAAHAAKFPGIALDLPGTIASHDDLAKQMAGMHVGWVNFADPGVDTNLTLMVGASNKPFDYLASGLALLVPADGAWKDFFVEPGYARPCPATNVQEIAKVIRWLYEHPNEVAQMGEMGRQRILSEWNYETQFGPVKAELEKV